MDATAQVALVREGTVTPAELVQAAVARAEKSNPALNAIVHPRFDAAVHDATAGPPDGPLHGVPMALKDLDGFEAGQPYHGGMRALADAGFVPRADTWLTQRFRSMGAVSIGRTNVPELGLVPSTEPLLYGPSHNPWDLGRSPAGSSGGSAAAVAAGIVPLAHAGDGGGSIRLPAAACGLVGLKPSRGRITMGPEAGEAWAGLVGRFVLSRTVRDTAAVLQAVAGPGPGDPYRAPPPSAPYPSLLERPPAALRVAWTVQPPDPAVPVDPEIVAAVEATAGVLEAAGHGVERRDPRGWGDGEQHATFAERFVQALAAWTAGELANLAALAGTTIDQDGVEPGTWLLAEMGRSLTATQYLDALGHLNSFARQLGTWWDESGIDLLVTPSCPELPWTLGQFVSTSENPLVGMLRSAPIVSFAVPFNVSGQPAMSLPLGWSAAGLPIGVQLVAAQGREDLLLSVAAQLEQSLPWAQRRPAIAE